MERGMHRISRKAMMAASSMCHFVARSLNLLIGYVRLLFSFLPSDHVLNVLCTVHPRFHQKYAGMVRLKMIPKLAEVLCSYA